MCVNLPLRKKRFYRESTIPRAAPDCGEGKWYRVADFNASSNPCPLGWLPFSASGIAHCGLFSFGISCGSATFSTAGVEYNRVCGRITGRAIGEPDAFTNTETLDGVQVTHSDPPVHIWSLAAASDPPSCLSCTDPPAFVGGNYFCDYTTSSDSRALWTGEDCETSCCGYNTPPFSVRDLPSSTTDDIDVHICSDVVVVIDNVLVESVELLVQ